MQDALRVEHLEHGQTSQEHADFIQLEIKR